VGARRAYEATPPPRSCVRFRPFRSCVGRSAAMFARRCADTCAGRLALCRESWGRVSHCARSRRTDTQPPMSGTSALGRSPIVGARGQPGKPSVAHVGGSRHLAVARRRKPARMMPARRRQPAVCRTCVTPSGRDRRRAHHLRWGHPPRAWSWRCERKHFREHNRHVRSVLSKASGRAVTAQRRRTHPFGAPANANVQRLPIATAET